MVMKLMENEEMAVIEFSAQVKEKLGAQVKNILLYGSKARGDGDKYSDIDIFILIEEKGKDIKKFVIDKAFDINLKYNVVISPIIYDKKSFNSPIAKVTPFLRNVVNEGIKA